MKKSDNIETVLATFIVLILYIVVAMILYHFFYFKVNSRQVQSVITQVEAESPSVQGYKMPANGVFIVNGIEYNIK